jgi:hypothetical protein
MSTKSSSTLFSNGWEDDWNSSKFSNLSHQHPLTYRPSPNRSIASDSNKSSLTAPPIKNVRYITSTDSSLTLPNPSMKIIHHPHKVYDSEYKQNKLYNKLVDTMRKKAKKTEIAWG